MTLHALDIPEPEAIPTWLERHVVGPHLGKLVAELTAVHAEAGRERGGCTLDDVLGERTPEVLQHGLASVVGRDGCAALLQAPWCLLELQECVLAEGGAYWDGVASGTTEFEPLVDRGWGALAQLVAGETAAVVAGDPPRIRRVDDVAPHAPSNRHTPRGPWSVALLSSLLTAAAMLLAMVGWQRFGPPSTSPKASGWGWSRPGVLATTETRSGHLAHLADAAEDWFGKRPETAESVTQRILEFRQGCSQLIFAEHAPLTEADRSWLRTRCRLWAAKLDAHVADLELGDNPLAVREAADETIRKLIGALRVRAETV